MTPSVRTGAAVQSDQNRQDVLEWLYHRDRRQDPGHPAHGTYTGLYQQSAAELGRLVLGALQEHWQELDPQRPVDLKLEQSATEEP